VFFSGFLTNNSHNYLLRSGPFNFLVSSELNSIEENIARLYDTAKYPESIQDLPFIDFNISVTGSKSKFTLWKNQNAEFRLDSKKVFNPFPTSHVTAMLEWGMNWCISTQINTYLIIHAAVIEKYGFAVILPAPPGSGKSTLCATLIQEGWRLLSDELTLLDLSTAKAVPMPRPISLKNQSIDIIKARYPQTIFGLSSSETIKGNVCHLKPPIESIRLQSVQCPVRWIVFPKFENKAFTQLRIKPKGEAFLEIANNAFNYNIIGTSAFNTLRTVVDQSECFTFQYSNLDEAIEVFDRLGLNL